MIFIHDSFEYFAKFGSHKNQRPSENRHNPIKTMSFIHRFFPKSRYHRAQLHNFKIKS